MAKTATARTVLIAGLVGAALAVSGFLLAPNSDEQAAMQRRDLFEHAQILYTAGDHASGISLLERAAASGDVSPDMVRTLLSYYAADGRAEDHLRLLRANFEMLRPVDIRAAASLYDHHAMPQAARAMREDLQRRGAATPSEMAMLAFYKLGDGKAQPAAAMAYSVARRLTSGREAHTAAVVVSVLANAQRPDLARSFAMRWLTSATPLAARLEIAPALVDGGLPEIAVDALREHHQASPEAREIYVRALRAAAASSPQIRVELTRDILRSLPSMQAGAYYDVALHDLFAFGDIDLVISELGASGKWRQEPMRSAFIYSLRQHGRSAALVQLLSAEARSPSTGIQEARTSARQVAELGAVSQAEGALRVIAAREGPAGQALQDLMYLWSSHDQQADTAWFAERARTSSGTTAQQWVTAVARGVSGPAAVETIEKIGRHPDAGTAGALTVLQARYLGWQGDSPRLRRALSQAAELQLASADATEMARLACAIGDAEMTAQLSARVTDPEHHGQLKACSDQFALDAARRAIGSDPQAALARYAALVEQGADLTAQDYFDYAEATAHSRDPAGAPALYEAALAKLPVREEESPRVTFLRAAILVQLRRHDEAREKLEGLLAVRPNNARARIMLTELLLDMGRYQEALAVSSSRPVRTTADLPQS